MTLRKTILSGAIAGTLLVLGLCARGGERVASSWGASSEVASASCSAFTTEDAEIYGRSRRSSPPEIKPSKPQNHAADYTRFSPLALGKWKSGKVEEWKSSATHFSTIQLFYYSTRAKRVGRAFGLNERSGTASAESRSGETPLPLCSLRRVAFRHGPSVTRFQPQARPIQNFRPCD